MLGVCAVVLEGKYRASRVTEQVDSLAPEVSAERIELPHEVSDVEKRRVRYPIGLTTTKLVVPHYRSVIAQGLERLHVVTRVARAAVQEDHRRASTGPRDPVPYASVGHSEHRFARGDGRAGTSARRRVAACGKTNQQRERGIGAQQDKSTRNVAWH